MAGELPATSGIGNGRRWSKLKNGTKAQGLSIIIAPKMSSWTRGIAQTRNRDFVGGLRDRVSKTNSANDKE